MNTVSSQIKVQISKVLYLKVLKQCYLHLRNGIKRFNYSGLCQDLQIE
jgi:dUTPase